MRRAGRTRAVNTRMSALDDERRQTSESAPAPRRRRNVFSRITYGLILCAGLILFGGFAWFVARLPADEITLDRGADGIVVLTGGASRIADAIELLASGRGRRLLISGVHPTTSSREIARLMPTFERELKCCVDLDHSALNTVGNAVETRRWAEHRGFRSLIVVTSGYHMPRAMLELAHQMPAARLIAFPVVSERLRSEPWWQNAEIARLLVSEYLKYIYAAVRISTEAPEPAVGGRLSQSRAGVVADR